MFLKHRTTYLTHLESALLANEDLLQRDAKPADLLAYFAKKSNKNGKATKAGEKYALLDVVEDRQGRQGILKKHMTIESKANFKTRPRSEELSEWSLLMASSCNWRDVDPKSRSQKWNDISRATIVEYWKVQKDRKELITETAAALFRDKIEKRMSKFAATRLRQGKQVKEWRFWDHQDAQLSKIKAPLPMTVDEQDAIGRERTMLNAQTADINKIIRTVWRSQVAKEDSEDVNLEYHVHNALMSLVEVTLEYVV